MTEMTAGSKFAVPQGSAKLQRAGVVEGAFADTQQFAALAALFPDVQFEVVAPSWPDRACDGMVLLLVEVDGASATELDAVAHRLRLVASDLHIVVLLRNADVTTTRLLMRAGAADVIPAPASETTLTVTLDKLLRTETAASARRPDGEIISVLKAGGGVGATALAVQAAAMAAHRGVGVCLADLDLQFGAASVYMDLANAPTVLDCLAAGTGLMDVNFSALLHAHASGARLLAAPRQVTPLETLAPPQAEALINALKRSFAVTLVDLPAVWTAWTNRVLQMSDHIVIVTHLSVPHMHMLDRQIATLRAQGLENRRLTLVCNALSPEQTSILSLKAAERALGRAFDIVAPEDKLMSAALNQGVEIAAVRRGSKLESAIGEFATLLAPESGVASAAERGKSWWNRSR